MKRIEPQQQREELITMVIAAISRQREWAFQAFMREFTDSGASTLLVIAVAFCHLSIFGN